MTGDQGGPYGNMFEGWQPAGVVSAAAPAAAVPYATGMVQSTFLQPPAGAPGEMHFPAGWHAQRQQVCAFQSLPEAHAETLQCRLSSRVQAASRLAGSINRPKHHAQTLLSPLLLQNLG